MEKQLHLYRMVETVALAEAEAAGVATMEEVEMHHMVAAEEEHTDPVKADQAAHMAAEVAEVL